jgi:hypothetical protein
MCSQDSAVALQKTCLEQSAALRRNRCWATEKLSLTRCRSRERVPEQQRSCLEQGAALRRICPWATVKLSWTKCCSGKLVSELQRSCLEQSAAQENLSLSYNEVVLNKVPLRRTCIWATEKLSWTKCRTQEKPLLGYREHILNKIRK